MGIPFESFLPYVIMGTFMTISGVGLTTVKHFQNGGKWPRYNTDKWDRQMMDRDQRLTGYLRGQSDRSEAPDGFELNSYWKMESRRN